MNHSHLLFPEVHKRLAFGQKIHSKNQRDITFQDEKSSMKMVTTKQHITPNNLRSFDNLSICQANIEHTTTILNNQTKTICKTT